MTLKNMQTKMKSQNKKIKGFPLYKQTKMRVVNYIEGEKDNTKYEQMKMRDRRRGKDENENAKQRDENDTAAKPDEDEKDLIGKTDEI